MSDCAFADATIRKELFLDERFVEKMSGLTRRFHQAVKCSENPVIRTDRPWEIDAAFVDTGMVIYDEKEQLFKAWYQGGGCYGPEDGSHMCYATSKDGIEWEKPSLGVVEYKGSKDNNIVLMAKCMMHDPAPIIDLKEPDPQKRFKAIWWGGRREPSAKDGWLLGHCVGFSADGISWTEHPDNPVWPSDPEVAVPFGLEHRRGKYVMYNSADGYGMRVTARAESEDFVHWKLPPKLVFQSDEEDVPGTEIGGMGAIDYYGTQIGMLWVIRNLPDFTREEWRSIVERNIRQGFLGAPIALNAVRCRIMYTELATSVDGLNWQRINRQPFISFGPEESWDECLLLAAKPIVANDKIYIYYTGQGRVKQTPGTKEAEKIGKWNIDTGLAMLRLDGFVSLQTGSEQGVLVTKDFIFEGNKLAINVDADKGSVKLEILDEAGEPIGGFTKDEAETITGDELRAEARWKTKKDCSELKGRRIKLRLFLENADLYSISVVS
ncbi:MAG: hypothetical protein JXB29_10825 [Sedimentisphaerales bacterium]|nr:hypothetical protein [Sedimentisphaerales bacterium]